MTTSIKCGDNVVLSSGTVFSFGNSLIEISLLNIDGVKGGDFTLQFSFVTDEGSPEPRCREVTTSEEKCFHLELINYNNQMGTGILQPLQFASNKRGSKLFVVFMVRTWGPDLSRQLSYTIFQTSGKEISNEQK